jgi:hypothetical protein
MMVGAAVVAVISGCVSATGSSEGRGTTRARYAGAVPVTFTNATPARMCGLYMTEDAEDDYGDNWLPEAGLPTGGSLELRMKPGKYKARWDTCPERAGKPFYAATLWRESAVVVQRETQLYAFIADAVAPTKRAPVKGRDHNIVRFPGQPVDPSRSQPQAPQPQQVALRAVDEPLQIAGFIGRVVLNAELVAQRDEAAPEIAGGKFDAREFVDGRARPAAIPPAAGKPPAAAGKPPVPGAGKPPAAGAGKPPAPGAGKPPAPGDKPSLDRKHDLSSSGIEYRKR